MKLNEKVISKNLIYDGSIIKVYHDDVMLPNGKIVKREKVHHSGGAAILAILDDEAIMIEQYRYAYEKVLLEIPAGKLENNESPLNAASRELEEETGYASKDIELIYTLYPSVGYTDEIIYIYAAKNLVKTKMKLDEDEFVNVKKIKLEKLYEMVSNNEIHDAKTAMAIMCYINKNRL